MKIKNFLLHLGNNKHVSRGSILTYEKHLLFLKNNNFNYESALKEMKEKNISLNTIRLFCIICKQFYSFYGDDQKNQIYIPKINKTIHDYLTGEEYIKLTNYFKKNKNGILKKVIVRLLFETGIRSAELLEIKISDIKDNKIIINGKGNKQRNVWLSESLMFDLNEYIKYFNITGKLFKFKYKNLYKKIRCLGKSLNKKLTPHMFRRGFATYCMKRNVDIYSLSQMMGHSDLNTTKTYIYDFDLQSKMENLFQ